MLKTFECLKELSSLSTISFAILMTPSVATAILSVIPANPSVIPAKAGIHFFSSL